VTPRYSADALRGATTRDGAGALLSLGIAVALYTRFGFDDALRRDEAIYVYAGQQLADGVPPFASIFDPKTPLASMIAGAAVAVGDAFGVNDLHAVRAAYFVSACLTVIAVYLLVLRLWRSPLAGVVAATVFASFRGFAIDAAGGPNAKTPGILFAVACMALLAHRRWFWAAFVGSLAFLVWQPLVVYAATAIAVAPLMAPAGVRRRSFGLAVAGAAVPVVLTTLYFALAGALGKLVEAAIVFPATGIRRGAKSLTGRLEHIVTVVQDSYGLSGVLFFVGLVLLLALVARHLVRGKRDLPGSLRDPLVWAVLPTLVGVVAFSMSDFQGYPDLYPLLPYAAVGFGGAVAVLPDLHPGPGMRRGVTTVALVLVLVLTTVSWSLFSDDSTHSDNLAAQRGAACDLDRLLGPDRNALYVLGDPTPLTLTHRRNPSRFIYLNSGVDRWVITHTPGGSPARRARIVAADPDVILVHGWHSGIGRRTAAWLGTRYDSAYLGEWQVFLAPGIRARAVREGVDLRARPAPFAAAIEPAPPDGCDDSRAYATMGVILSLAAGDPERHHGAR
jgi:hypothetical protein